MPLPLTMRPYLGVGSEGGGALAQVKGLGEVGALAELEGTVEGQRSYKGLGNL